MLALRISAMGTGWNVMRRAAAWLRIRAVSRPVCASPAMSMDRPFSSACFSNASRPYRPMSRTAIICNTVSGLSPIMSFPWSMPGLNHPEVQFSMKNTGRMMTQDGKPSRRTVSSTRHLLSKWGIPVLCCADATEVYTKCWTPRRLASSAIRLPCASSCSTPASHVFWTAKTPQTPSSARSRLAGSSKSPLTTVAPRLASTWATGLSGFLVNTATRCFLSKSSWATAPPWWPVAPVTRIRSFPTFIGQLPRWVLLRLWYGAERRRFLLLARGCHLAPEYVPRRVVCLERAGRRIPREVIDGTRGDHLPLPQNAGVRSGFCDDAVAAHGENAHRDRVVAWERNGPALAVGRRGDRIRHDHAVLGTDHASALPAAGDVGELDAGPLRLDGWGGGVRRVLGTGRCSDDGYSDGRKEQDGTHSQTPSWKRERTTGGLAGG